MILTENAKSLWSYNPIPRGCVLFAPLWALRGDVFRSVDYYRHTLTNTGSTLLAQGRTFDGVDDKIGLGNSSLLYPTAITLIIWAKTSTTEAAPLFTWQAADNRPAFYLAEAGPRSRLYRGYHSGSATTNDRTWNQSPVDLADGNWHMIMLTIPSKVASDISNCILYADDMQEQTVIATSTGEDVATQGTVQIAGSDADYKAIDVGLVIEYDRVLTVSEGSRIFLATKVRY